MPEQSSQCIPVLDIVFSRLQDRGLPAIDLVVCTHFQAHKMSGILLPEGDYIKPLKGLMYNYPMVTFQTEAGTIFCAMTVSQLGGRVLHVDDLGVVREYCGS